MTSSSALPKDDSGYKLTTADLRFLQIPEDSADRCINQHAPLGMTAEQYEQFVSDLVKALWRENFRNADVRLQGSAAKFFSGPHKSMPYSPEEVHEAFMRERNEPPDTYELNPALSKIEEVWPPENRPLRRPFDAFYRIGIAPEPSDYDVQISTDDAFDIVTRIHRYDGLNPNELVVTNANYQFMLREYSDRTFLYLQRWSAVWSERLERSVNIAIFTSSGPKHNLDVDENLSSHFKNTDWIIDIDTKQQALQQTGVGNG